MVAAWLFLCCCFFCLLPVTAGKISAEIVPKTIQASAGGSVTLPCFVSLSGEVPTVEWSKKGLNPNIVFLYRDGCEDFAMKHLLFRYRTNLIMNELHHGNLSLIISNLMLSDSGMYQCAILKRKLQIIATVDLIVGVVSDLNLRVVQSPGSGLTLECEAKCWSPEPEVTFTDDQRNELSAEDSKRYKDDGGCFTVTRRMTLRTATNRVMCVVHQSKTNQHRSREIYIPDDCMKSCTGVIVAAVVVTTLICALVAFLIKKYCYSVEGDVKDKKICQLTDQVKELESKLADSRSTPSTPKLNLTSQVCQKLRTSILTLQHPSKV
ncbi:butyrophilin subfamily 1 member A1-like [Pholidichthys leucotaenia]